ncbi:DUF1850 domain-containing protein [Paracoccus tegillarcae]|uniref:DUF1850 domain-containing protein n=1 Tax=Paracoccus tegillarcae TaxID=1529068 RepID=A0A2K9EID3_9RHOB|nr:DUF1850 domain-containing protein [Paracoccus tegillarcae]AUH34758.1 DUF1850 domain-containing protein [Paracoccus tegillarcae]
MSSCLLVGGAMIALAGPGFTLEWTHSVEHTIWHEDWIISEGHLVLTGAAVKGSGAGMDPGPGAVLRDGWWVWSPDLPPQPQIVMAASGATGGGWRICDAKHHGEAAGNCRDVGQQAGEPLILRPCDPAKPAQ